MKPVVKANDGGSVNNNFGNYIGYNYSHIGVTKPGIRKSFQNAGLFWKNVFVFVACGAMINEIVFQH